MRDRPAFDLFLVSWLVLFLELAFIRWFPSHVLFLTFFTNTVLLACFVGMSVGCLVARRPTRLLNQTPLLLAIAIGFGVIVNAYSDDLLPIFKVGNQADPDVIFFGTEHAAVQGPSFTIPIEVVGGLFFLLIAAAMVGPGQEMGRAFNRVTDRTKAYTANLLGSLVGIGMFAACSYLRLPPIVWFALSICVLGYFLLRPDSPESATTTTKTSPATPLIWLAMTIAMTAFTSGLFPSGSGQLTTWSPYYRIDYIPQNRGIKTNLIGHQLMEPLDDATVAPYALPYLFQKDVKDADGKQAWAPFKKVLIIGAGSGNDVARALHWLPKDALIDAVEIDPVIQSIGSSQHPDKPFQDPRVTVYLNDGRNFLRKSPNETYDLVIFALIDSLVLQSGYSNLRLESYLFTLESFKDVRRVLKPTGVYAVYNFFRQGWLACRIRDQLRTAFNGSDPVVMTFPPRASIPLQMETFDHEGFTMFFSGSPEVLNPLRSAFTKEGKYWYPWLVGVRADTTARFSPTKPAQAPLPPPGAREFKDYAGNIVEPRWMGLEIASVEEPKGLRQATDDWPFLYAREATIPGLTLRGVVLTLVLSVVVWFAFLGHKSLGSGSGAVPEWGLMLRSFFLGAGFMLVETKAIVEMALLFGGTWMVNTVVFAAILVMSLIGNLYAKLAMPKRLEPYYAGLFTSLAIGLVVPLGAFLGLDPTLQILAVCALVFTPVAFAGVIFATNFQRTNQPDRVFGMNVAGALCGGLAENTSVLLGFQLLLCVAVGFYVLSAITGNQKPMNTESEKGV
ncbi:MAG: hypothetical protein C0467_14305 [Planctomycetaceae bacterium]|nr:hypothetical protein [Planctomycetaceae bacterium]